MFYAFRVNSALAKLGAGSLAIKPEYWASMLLVGKQRGHSPQEVALFILAQLPAGVRGQPDVAVIRKWIGQRKIDPASRDMQDALDVRVLWDQMR